MLVVRATCGLEGLDREAEVSGLRRARSDRRGTRSQETREWLRKKAEHARSREASLEMGGGRRPTMWRRCAGTLRVAAAGQTDRQTHEYEYEYKGEDFDAEKVVACTAGRG